jgi:uncharacterized lipoprotein YajG
MESQLSKFAVLLVGLACLTGCGEQAPPGKHVSGDEYNKAVNSTLTEEDKRMNAQIAQEAAVPATGKR